uniref:Uncharacterized protein n=1 Tax=Entomoneis paludosa TaxID=265537 RepID=A0A7S2Y5F3_9STRA
MDALDASFCQDAAVKDQVRTQLRQFAEFTGVIDEFGNPLEQVVSDREDDQHAKSKQKHYRRSLSENFKDRVYLQTKVAAVLAAQEEGEDESDAQLYI